MRSIRVYIAAYWGSTFVTSMGTSCFQTANLQSYVSLIWEVHLTSPSLDIFYTGGWWVRLLDDCGSHDVHCNTITNNEAKMID